jgi:hypothetical protein
VIYWVNISHAVFDNAPDFFQSLVWAHCADGVSLNENVSSGEKLKSFEGGTRRSENPLPSFNESFLVVD